MRRRRSTFLSSSLRQGRLVLACVLALSVLALVPARTALAATFTVTKTADTNDGTCDADCSLREAIIAANAAAGADTISLPAGTYTLTLAGSDDTANLGDLDVTEPVTINGAGQASTIIQAGTTSSNGIDKILSFNPLGTRLGFAVSISNLTLRFGKNPETFVNGNGFGGCFDFDSGTSGAGSLNVTNVTVTDCQTTDGDGGGGAIFLTSGGTVTLSNATIQNNTAHRPSPNFGIGGGLFFGCAGGTGATVTINTTTIANNRALDSGAQGGGMFLFGRCSGTPTLNYQLHAVTISGNQAANDGGGIYSTAPLTIDNLGGPTVISTNTSGRSGGGLWLNHTSQTSTISKVTISGNSAADGGGGIRLDSASPGNVLNLSFSRIVNNTAGSGKGSGLSVNNGTANADNNWWGCSTGPSAAPCNTAKVDPGSGGGAPGTGSMDFTPWLRVLTTASPATIVTNQSTSLTASVNTNSDNQDVSANNELLKGLPVTWSAVGGTLSGQQATIQPNGTATATYQATAALVGNLAVAKVDNDGTTTGSNVVSITVNKASTTATITADTPDPTVTGQPYTVSYSVVGSQGNTPTAPTGNVTVSDGTNSCTGGVAAGQCTLTSMTAGNKTLTATYAGDANFLVSPASAGVAHIVNKADTTTTITSDTPDPSVVGQSVTISYGVTVNSPGSGTPTGDVTVSDGGSNSCTGTVAAGSCTITFTTAGNYTLTATYAGDANYNASPASASVSHQVNKANTTTTITSDNPDPSNVGEAVAVNFTVAPVAPGAGTPTGNVTVSDGVDNCTGTVATGTCTITLTTPGARTLAATYAGDSNFNPSTSANEPHTVDRFATTTTIDSDTPDPSVVGQSVTVQYSVTSASGTPTGDVTVSDGTIFCTASVAAGQCSLTFTSAGARSLTATYAGDSTFDGSASGAEPHQVNQADTTTTITSDNPDPSGGGQSVTVQFTVVADAPGAGTPTGNVTVSDDVDSCTGTVAAGSCNIALTTPGARTLTATYAGDSNFNPSTSAGVPHTVDIGPPAVTINQASGQPDPTSTSPIHFTAVFTEPVTGFATGDVTLSGTAGATTAIVTEIAPNNGTTYDVAVSDMTTNGTVIASIPAGVATDAVGNDNTASFSTDNTVTFNFNVAPTFVVTNGQCSATNMASGGIDLTLDDPDGDTLTLTLASNSNPTLVPNANIVLGGSGNNRTLTITAASRKSGVATLTLNLSDGTVTIPIVITVKVGSDKNETLTGMAGIDMIFGLAGKSTINGLGGNDLLCGGNGVDTINGGNGNDIIDGGNGNDTINGGDNNDILRGNLGDDSLTGSTGADSFSGGAGTDTATDFNAGQGDTQDGTIP